MTLTFRLLHRLPNSAWADGNLAEAVVQLGKMVEHTHIKVNPTKVSEQMNHPVVLFQINASVGIYRIPTTGTSTEPDGR